MRYMCGCDGRMSMGAVEEGEGEGEEEEGEGEYRVENVGDVVRVDGPEHERISIKNYCLVGTANYLSPLTYTHLSGTIILSLP
jgi:hypothetical protein